MAGYLQQRHHLLQHLRPYIYGIYLGGSFSNSVTKNVCGSNNYTGIYLFSSWSNDVVGNTCNNNLQYGVYLYVPVSTTPSRRTPVI